MSHLVALTEELEQKCIWFRSICNGEINTTTISDKLTFNRIEGTQ